MMWKPAIVAAVLLAALPAQAQTQAGASRVVPAPSASLQSQAELALSKAPKGVRFGLLVVDQDGRVLVSINPDMRFLPASNTKLFTTAAALALLPGVDQPDVAGGTQLFLTPAKRRGSFDVRLYGRGDALMSSAADCQIDCLATLADAVAAKTKHVGDIIGDDSFFPDQRWSPGMSWNNLGSNDATAASALSLDGNEATLRVVASQVGARPRVDGSAYARIQNEANTVQAGQPTTLGIGHTLNSREFRLYGQIAMSAPLWSDRIGIDDPADYTAVTFAQMLRARGVKISGTIGVRHRAAEPVAAPPSTLAVAPAVPAVPDAPVAQLLPPPLQGMAALINKPSQNHHAELLLRRIGRIRGSGSLDDGLVAERAFLAAAGVPREGYDLYDGSGMSTYNRVSPRAMIALFRFAQSQPWGRLWFDSLPVAGVDGTLKRRFVGTPLAANLSAKTGTLNATNALSGTFRSASGRTLTFAFFANDVPDGSSALATMDATLLVIAAAS